MHYARLEASLAIGVPVQLQDADGGGTLDREEMKELVLGLGQTVNEKELGTLMKEMDAGPGTNEEVDFNGFVKWSV